MTLEQVRVIGQGGEHLQAMLRLDNGKSVRGVWFRNGHLAESLHASAGTHTVVFALAQSTFGGEPVPEIRIHAIQESECDAWARE